MKENTFITYGIFHFTNIDPPSLLFESTDGLNSLSVENIALLSIRSIPLVSHCHGL